MLNDDDDNNEDDFIGNTRSTGLFVALNAGSPEFLEALFNRDVDPQFKQDKDYICARSLTSIHRKNVLHA